MNKFKGYEENIRFDFWAAGQLWAVTDVYEQGGETLIDFEELRKNGQEDSHERGIMRLADGFWIVDPEEGREQIILYSGVETIDALEAFFNEHGPPSKE